MNIDALHATLLPKNADQWQKEMIRWISQADLSSEELRAVLTYGKGVSRPLPIHPLKLLEMQESLNDCQDDTITEVNDGEI